MITDATTAGEAAVLWTRTLTALSGRLPDHVHQGLSDLMRPIELRDGTLVLEVPTGFFRDLLNAEHRAEIENAVRAITGSASSALLIRTAENSDSRHLAAQFLPAPAVDARPAPAPRPNLNPRYVLERFVIGNSNRFAFSAAQTVSQDPGRAYNPLILWGGVGLGKTHLLHAIGHAVLARNAAARVLCVNSEAFVNDYVRALTERSMIQFKQRYRTVDLLLVDDIQFLEGKEATQEEFFHTFNELAESQRQIVATSDRHPSELSRLEDRLRSRFQMGLVADIGQPDFELRLAILRTKARVEGVPLPDDVAHYLAEAREANIRELEGDLTTVVAYASMHQLSLSVETAQQALRGRMLVGDRKLTTDLIQKEVARQYGVSVADLRSQARTAELVRARQIAMHLCRTLIPNLSLAEIGDRFSKDHTTVMYGLEKLQRLMNDGDTALTDEIQRLAKQLRASS